MAPVSEKSRLKTAPMVFVLVGIACGPNDRPVSDNETSASMSTSDESLDDATTDPSDSTSSSDATTDANTSDSSTDTMGDTTDGTGTDTDTDTGTDTGTETGEEPVPDCSDPNLCTGTTLWSRAIGGPMVQWGSAVTTIGDRVFAVGFTNDTVITGDLPDLVGLSNDLVVFEFDAATGTVLWTRVIAGQCSATARITGSIDELMVLGSCAGEVDVAGTPLGNFISGAFVVGRFSLDGMVTGADGFAASGGPVGASWISADGAGGYALIGYFSGSINFGLGNLQAVGNVQDMVAVVFEADGSPRWSRRFGDDAAQLGLTGQFAPNGDLLVFGANKGTIDFGGNPLAGDGLAAARLDADTGQPVWSTLFPGNGNGYDAVSAGSATGVVVATRGGSATPPTVLDLGNGDLSGHSLVVGLDYDGVLQWERSFESQSPTAGLGLVYAVAIDQTGSVVLAGHGVSTVDLGLGEHVPSGRDGFVTKLDADGEPTDWVRWVSDWDQQSLEQRLQGVAVDTAGTVYVIGRFAGHVNLGDQELIADGEDILLAALEP